MINQCPQLVGSAFISDPVVFLLHWPDICRNVAYPDLTNCGKVLQRYCLVGELGAATTIMRHFWWHRNVLWLDDIPDRLKGRMVVAMGSKDFVAPADAVMRYLSLDSRVRTLLARGGQPSCCLLEALHSCMGDALLAGEHVQWAGQSEQARNLNALAS